MDRTLNAVASGIIEGLLICAGVLSKNVLALGLATVFFIVQWKHMGK